MPDNAEVEVAYNLQPFRRAVFRGLGLVLPPLLTFAILLWIANSVEKILDPFASATRHATVWFINETKAEIPEDADPNELAEEFSANTGATIPTSSPAEATSNPEQDQVDLQQVLEVLNRIQHRLDIEDGLAIPVAETKKEEPLFKWEEQVYVRLANGEWIPQHVRDAVEGHVRESGTPLAVSSGRGYYDHYVQHQILKRSRVIPVFFAGFILLMYLLGKFLAAGVGRYFWNLMESVINQLPIIRTVYSSVKQVTDFFVGESDVDEFQRVVAVEYPRKGVWSVGFVTGESLLTIRGAAEGEAIVSVLMPTSPVPGTGFTITVRKSETIDLDIPIEQALQFVVSCGVVIPDDELQDKIAQAQLEEGGNLEFGTSGAEQAPPILPKS